MTKDKGFYKSFFSLYFVLILHQLITLFTNLADNIMIGSYSETALAGVAAVNQIQFIFSQIVMSSGDALVVLGSQYWGGGDREPIKRLITAAMWIVAAVALVLFALAAATPEGMVSVFTKDPQVIAEGAAYLGVIKYTYLLFALTNILLAGLRSVETVKIGFAVSLVALAANCSLNYMFIGGNLGAPELGAVGAGVGTLTARALELIIVVIYVLAADKKVELRPRDIIKPERARLTEYLRVNWRFVLVGAMFGVSTALQTVVLGHLSKEAMAANSASTALFQVLKVIAIGASAASAVIIGKTIGAAKSKEECLPKLKEYTKTLQVMYLIIGAILSVSLYILRLPVLSLYSSLSPRAYELAKQFILVLCFTGFGTAYQMPVVTGIIRGGGDSKFVLINDLISIWGIVLPVSFLGAFVWHWEPVWVVLSLNSDQIFKCAAACIKVNRFKWVKKLTQDK